VSEETLSFTVPPEAAGRRLDAFVAASVPGLTRSHVERLSKSNRVRLNGAAARAGRRVSAGDVVEVATPSPPPETPQPEPVPLQILFEDEHVIVVSKPAGMVVHPGAGRTSGTLVNALLAHAGRLAAGSGQHRPGIVHRLDRDTSGLLVAAKTDRAFAQLSGQVRRREVERRYLALTWGVIREDRLLIDVPIGRHQREATRMAAVPRPAEGRRVRPAFTDIAVLERLRPMTLVEARLRTGRTHQIRVHLAHEGHPVVGDPLYGARRARRERAALEPALLQRVRALHGQALHAHLLRFHHPVTEQEMSFSSPLPADIADLCRQLRAAARGDAA
jgi:23S rRNA pseudouridine1911/1915/1917 synthase